MERRVLKVIALMKETLHRGWSTGRLAECVNLSPSRLHQLFREETGLPPARYLRLLRMERARALLETSHLSVKQVMGRVGVTDESHFVRDFKKTYGHTPARYRQSFLCGRLDEDPAPRGSAPALTAPGLLPRLFPPPPPAATATKSVTAPPLLLRRPSYPHQQPSPARAHRRAELLSLLRLRQAAFAELTNEITGNIIDGGAGRRPISYRPRRSAASRRPPPSAERPRARVDGRRD